MAKNKKKLLFNSPRALSIFFVVKIHEFWFDAEIILDYYKLKVIFVRRFRNNSMGMSGWPRFWLWRLKLKLISNCFILIVGLGGGSRSFQDKHFIWRELSKVFLLQSFFSFKAMSLSDLDLFSVLFWQLESLLWPCQSVLEVVSISKWCSI